MSFENIRIRFQNVLSGAYHEAKRKDATEKANDAKREYTNMIRQPKTLEYIASVLESGPGFLGSAIDKQTIAYFSETDDFMKYYESDDGTMLHGDDRCDIAKNVINNMMRENRIPLRVTCEVHSGYSASSATCMKIMNESDTLLRYKL